MRSASNLAGFSRDAFSWPRSARPGGCRRRWAGASSSSAMTATMIRARRGRSCASHDRRGRPSSTSWSRASSRKVLALYAKRIAPDWQGRTLLHSQLRAGAGIDVFRKTWPRRCRTSAWTCIDAWGARWDRGRALERSRCGAAPARARILRGRALRGRIVRARVRDGALELHEGGTPSCPAATPSPRSRSAHPGYPAPVDAVDHTCTHYVAGAGEHAYLRQEKRRTSPSWPGRDRPIG